MHTEPDAPSDASSNAVTDGALPFERDQQATPPKEDAQHRHNRKPMEQAHSDVESGIQDTERIGTPSDVPDSGTNRGTG